MNVCIDSVLDALSHMRVYQGAPGTITQLSHKHVFLLALVRLYEANPKRPNRFPLDEELEGVFEAIWSQVRTDTAPANAIEYPFYHLRNDGFWYLSIKTGADALFRSYEETRLTRSRLQKTVDYGYLRHDFDDCMRNRLTRSVLTRFLQYGDAHTLSDSQTLSAVGQREIGGLDSIGDNGKAGTNSIEPSGLPEPPEEKTPNPFVTYLNSLHSIDASNENALAEAQACNPMFSRIHVEHPLVMTIIEQLRAKPLVVLTGHAGDGKSTIAMSVFKRLAGLEGEETLSHPLNCREDIQTKDGPIISIVKDLSEWPEDERLQLLSEVECGVRHMLLVSNTGALLDSLCKYAEEQGLGGRVVWEPNVLGAMDSEYGTLELAGQNIAIVNLALRDNLSLARHILERMLAAENWSACERQPCHAECPIYRNVRLLNGQSGLAIGRLFLAYRRMVEYGTRLTIRQLTAHLAYMLTSGLNHIDITRLASRPDKPLLTDFLFVNRFFGDDGREFDPRAARMKAVREVRSQGFGVHPCPSVERHLWLLTHGSKFPLGVTHIEAEFERLRYIGSRSSPEVDGLTPDQAREQVRRLIYFLHWFENDHEYQQFVRQFLGSLAIVKWKEWQKQDARLSTTEEGDLMQRVFHVLQEQFAGIRLPELRHWEQNHLYITLSRRRDDIRQSAQVVVAKVDFSSEFKLMLNSHTPAESRRDLCLVGRGRLEGIKLPLGLPFLDYVLARQKGEVGESLQASYAERIERLKAELIRKCPESNEDTLLLVRLRGDHTFLRQSLTVNDGALEVSNA